MRATYRPRLDALDASDGPAGGTDATAVDRALLRTKLVSFLALEGRDPELRATLAGQARRYIGFGTRGATPDPGAVASAQVEVALQVGVQESGLPFVEALIEQMLASNDIQFRSQAALALGSTDDAAVGERVRKLLLDPQLRAREPTTIAFGLAARASQRRATFDWFKANHEAFIGRIGHFGYRWLPRFGAGFCTPAERDEVKAFFTPTAWPAGRCRSHSGRNARRHRTLCGTRPRRSAMKQAGIFHETGGTERDRDHSELAPATGALHNRPADDCHTPVCPVRRRRSGSLRCPASKRPPTGTCGWALR